MWYSGRLGLSLTIRCKLISVWFITVWFIKASCKSNCCSSKYENVVGVSHSCDGFQCFLLVFIFTVPASFFNPCAENYLRQHVFLKPISCMSILNRGRRIYSALSSLSSFFFNFFWGGGWETNNGEGVMRVFGVSCGIRFILTLIRFGHLKKWVCAPYCRIHFFIIPKNIMQEHTTN